MSDGTRMTNPEAATSLGRPFGGYTPVGFERAEARQMRDYDTTLARIAGTIAAGLVQEDGYDEHVVAADAVSLAVKIVDRVRAVEAGRRAAPRQVSPGFFEGPAEPGTRP